MHQVLVNRLGGLSLPRKSVVRLTDRPDMTIDVYRGRKTKIQQQQQYSRPQTVLIIILSTRALRCYISTQGTVTVTIYIGLFVYNKTFQRVYYNINAKILYKCSKMHVILPRFCIKVYKIHVQIV